MNIEDAVKSSITGHFIGDCFASAEDNQIDVLQEYSILTGSLLCTVASLTDFGESNTNDLMTKLYDMYIAGYMCFNDNTDNDTTETYSQAIKNFSNGLPPDKCGTDLPELNDGECMARVLPVALFYHNSVNDLIFNIHKSCEITHSDKRSIVCCCLFGLIIRNIMLNEVSKIFIVLEDYYKQNNMPEFIETLNNVLKQGDNPNSTNDVVDCFWSMFYCLKAHNNNFPIAIRESLKFGNSKIVSCLVGSVVALSEGVEGIPENWISNLKIDEKILAYITNFIGIIQQRMV